MRKLLVLAVLLTLSACVSRTEPPEEAFAGTIEYERGSVPPPYHYAWRLDVDTTTATLAWTPGYDDVDPWTATVDITEQDRERLYERLDTAGVLGFEDNPDEGLAGGSTGRVTTQDTDTGTLGSSRAGQDLLDEVREAAEDLVPDQIWRDMNDKQDEWSARQPK
jgi:hypothetical protein